MATKNPPKEKKQCSECGRSYGVPYIYQHLRKEHGVYGGRTGTTRAPKNGRKYDLVDLTTEKKPPARRAVEQIGGMRVMDDFKVLQAADGSIWIAERIR